MTNKKDILNQLLSNWGDTCTSCRYLVIKKNKSLHCKKHGKKVARTNKACDEWRYCC